MLTNINMNILEKELKEYKKRFLNKKYDKMDEASTRLMINFFLTDVLGYAEFEEIKTEYRIKGEYADYIIQVGRKKHFVVEVKSIELDLNEKHLRQAVNYAVNEGVDWVLLTNGSMFCLYKVLFNKPISTKKIFEYDLRKEKNVKNICKDLMLLSRKSVEKKELEKYWKRFEVIEPAGLNKLLYHKSVISAIRKVMKQKSGLNFSEGDVLNALYEIITEPIESIRPLKPIEFKIKNKQIKQKRDVLENKLEEEIS